MHENKKHYGDFVFYSILTMFSLLCFMGVMAIFFGASSQEDLKSIIEMETTTSNTLLTSGNYSHNVDKNNVVDNNIARLRAFAAWMFPWPCGVP